MEKIKKKTNTSRKQKNNTKQKNNIWGLFGGDAPWRKPKKLKKTSGKQKKHNIWGLLAGPPYPPRPLENCFFFFVFSRFFWFSNFLISKTSGKLYYSFPWHMSILAGICDILVICSIFASLFDLPARLAKPIASLAPAPEFSATQRQSCFTYFASSVYPL